MSVLVGSTVTLLIMVIGHFLVDLGGAVRARAQAQTAADAAALAAIAESGFYGTASPRSLADHYAQLNGAKLVDCHCAAGATSVQVEVAVGELTAKARAAVDPERFGPAGGSAVAGLHPALAAAVEKIVAESRGRVHLVSGYRSTQKQSMLWSRALATYGSPEAADDWVAPPGRSMHEAGLAVDLGGDIELAVDLIARSELPLYRPLPHEPWHFELLGSR